MAHISSKPKLELAQRSKLVITAELNQLAESILDRLRQGAIFICADESTWYWLNGRLWFHDANAWQPQLHGFEYFRTYLGKNRVYAEEWLEEITQ